MILRIAALMILSGAAGFAAPQETPQNEAPVPAAEPAQNPAEAAPKTQNKIESKTETETETKATVEQNQPGTPKTSVTGARVAAFWFVLPK